MNQSSSVPAVPFVCLTNLLSVRLRFLTYCPAKRITADEALKHEYFRESPLPIEPSMFPTWPAKSEQQRVKRGTSPRPPEGGLGFSQLVYKLSNGFKVHMTAKLTALTFLIKLNFSVMTLFQIIFCFSDMGD